MQNSRTVAKSGKIALGGFTGRPADILRSVGIGVCFVTTRTTPKLILTAILLCAIAALGASPAGVSRVNSDQQNSEQFGLVLQETAQLRERPGMQNCSLLSPSRDPVTDALEVFNGDSASSAFSGGNDLLADVVINPRGESSLTSRKRFQSALGCSGVLALQLISQSTASITKALYGSSAMSVPVRVTSDISHTEVNSEEVGRGYWCFAREIHGAMQIKSFIAKYQIGLTFDPIEALCLVLPVEQRENHPLIGQCPKANSIDTTKSHNALVIGDSSVRFEYRSLGFAMLAVLEVLYSFPDGAHCHLRGQAKTGAYLIVSQLLDARGAEDFGVKSQPSGERSGLVKPLHRQEQPLALLYIGEYL